MFSNVFGREKGGFMKKAALVGLCLALAVGMMTGCGTANKSSSSSSSSSSKSTTKISQMSKSELQKKWKKEPAYNTTIKVGYNGGACLGGLGIAKAKGFYQKEGLKVKIVSVKDASDAIGTGKVDMGGDHIATLLVPAVNGVKLTFTTASQTGCKSLYVLKSSNIKSTKDLKGKTIAVPDGIGGSDQNITMRYLNHDGIDVHSVKYKVVSEDAVVQAMKKGEVQAVNLSDMFAAPFVKDGTLKRIRSITYDKDFQKEPCCIIAINSDFLKKNPITAYKMTKAFSDANDWIQKNKPAAAKILLKNSWASGSESDLVGFMDDWNYSISDKDCQTALINVMNDYKKFKLFEHNNFNTKEELNRVWDPLLLNN